MDIDSFVIFLFLFILIAIVYYNVSYPMKYVEAYDGQKYLVIDDNLKNESANLLALMNEKSSKLMLRLKEKYGDDNENLNRLFRNYKPNQLKEKHPKSLGTSFTLNKQDVILCLKKNNGKSMVDENTLLFVLLHEISHIMTKSIGHQEDYWENFRFLLAHAIVANLYEFDSYKNEKRYCGINISSSPIKLNEIENYI